MRCSGGRGAAATAATGDGEAAAAGDAAGLAAGLAAADGLAAAAGLAAGATLGAGAVVGLGAAAVVGAAGALVGCAAPPPPQALAKTLSASKDVAAREIIPGRGTRTMIGRTSSDVWLGSSCAPPRAQPAESRIVTLSRDSTLHCTATCGLTADRAPSHRAV